MKAIIAALALATSLALPPGTAGALDRTVVGDHRVGAGRGEVLDVRRIERIVLREGFAEIADLTLRRDRYIVEAIRTDGAVSRIALDAYDGSLIGQERAGWARNPSREDHARRTSIEFRFGL